MAHKTRELRSTVNRDGVLTLSLAEIVLDDPASDEIIVRIEAAPINPSDLGLLLGRRTQPRSARMCRTAFRSLASIFHRRGWAAWPAGSTSRFQSATKGRDRHRRR